MKRVLGYTKVGRTPERWFSQTRPHWSREGARAAVFLTYTILASRAIHRPLPRPELVMQDDAMVVARWLAEKKREGRPGYLDTSVSGATRACLAAKEAGLDIAGSGFRTGGEPYTEAKADVLTDVGAHAVQAYGMSELGWVGLCCADPTAVDDLHIATEKVAVSQSEKQVGLGQPPVLELLFTSLIDSCPKLWLNAESGDYGDLEERRCGCLIGELGLSTHLIGLRSYDKLTSEGVTFIGSDLYRLVDEVLPGSFGGNPTDYQLVEEDTGGVPRVSVLVAPGVGAVDEAALVAAVLLWLGERQEGGPTMADQWRQAHTLGVLRREPYASGGRKILPLHVLQAPGDGGQAPP